MPGTKTGRLAAGGLDIELAEAVVWINSGALCVCVFILLIDMTLKLQFLTCCFYVVLNTTFTITSEVITITFKEGRSIHRLSFLSYILIVYLLIVKFYIFCVECKFTINKLIQLPFRRSGWHCTGAMTTGTDVVASCTDAVNSGAVLLLLVLVTVPHNNWRSWWWGIHRGCLDEQSKG